MLKRTIFFAALSSTLSLANAANWTDLKGLSVGMDLARLKELGFVCAKPSSAAPFIDWNCEVGKPAGNLATIGGEKITYLGAGVKSGKATMIVIKTSGPYGGGLEKTLATKLGKPKKAKGDWKDGHYQWDRGGAEFVDLTLGNGVNEISMAIDPTYEAAGAKKHREQSEAKARTKDL